MSYNTRIIPRKSSKDPKPPFGFLRGHRGHTALAIWSATAAAPRSGIASKSADRSPDPPATTASNMGLTAAYLTVFNFTLAAGCAPPPRRLPAAGRRARAPPARAPVPAPGATAPATRPPGRLTPPPLPPNLPDGRRSSGPYSACWPRPAPTAMSRSGSSPLEWPASRSSCAAASTRSAAPPRPAQRPARRPR